MNTPNRDLLVLLRNEYATQRAIEQEVECLNHILVKVESLDHFFQAHELAGRFRVTSRRRKLMRAIRGGEMKPFHFLLNKN